MKTKRVGLMVLVLHVVVLAGFSLMQGCTTGTCPISWLNWPYSSLPQEPMIFPAEDPMTLPPVSMMGTSGLSSAPYSGDAQTYSVRKGDTLSGIASMYGTTWKKLAEYNNLSNPNRLLAGQEIRIPSGLGGGAPAPVKRPSSPAKISRPSSPVGQGSSYVIQKGDTLGAIAKRSGLTVAEIKAANGMSSDRIIAGKSLTIPRKGEVKAPVVATKPAAPKPVVDASPAPMADFAPAPLADAAPAAAAPTASSSSAPVYEHVLYPGETLDDVARQYGSSKSEIMTLNGITDPASIKPGTKLLVPIPE